MCFAKQFSDKHKKEEFNLILQTKARVIALNTFF